MTQEFIPYEQALELKELGFDEPCFGTYLSSFQSDWKVYELILEMGMNEEFEDNRNVYLLEGACSAPTFSQAFRWFREKYNIQGYIYSSTVRGNSEKTKQFTGYIWNINGIDMPFISTDARDELHDTYEEAELACINKLIEIIENQKQK